MTAQNVMNNMAAGYNLCFFSFDYRCSREHYAQNWRELFNASTRRLSLCIDVECATCIYTVSWHLSKRVVFIAVIIAHLRQHCHIS